MRFSINANLFFECLNNGTITVKEFGTIEMVCSVNYSGNWAPVMKWQQDGGSVITDGRVVNNTVPYKRVAYSLKVRATRDMNWSKFKCTTYFIVKNQPSNTEADNIPDFMNEWYSSKISVECKYTSSPIPG